MVQELVQELNERWIDEWKWISQSENWVEAYSMVWPLAVTEENQYKASMSHSLVNVVIESNKHTGIVDWR